MSQLTRRSSLKDCEMQCSLNGWPLSSRPHGGEVAWRVYVDKQDSRFTQRLCDNHAPPEFWKRLPTNEHPFTTGFLKRSGFGRKGKFGRAQMLRETGE